MADEVKTETTTETPDPKAGGGNTDSVSLSKAEYDKLTQAAQKATALEPEVTALRENWNHAQRLLRTDGDPAEAQQSVRHVLHAAGYSPEQIEAYINAQAPETAAPEVQYRQEMDQIKEQVKQQRTTQLKGMLEASVTTALDTNKNLTNLLDKLTAINADDDAARKESVSKATEVIKDEVRRETLDRLRIRRAQSQGLWDDQWVGQEAANAANAVFSKYRSVIGDPSRIGRAPETVSGDEAILARKPVEPPEWKRGMDPSDAAAAVRNYAVDQLLRASVESTKGRSVV